MCGEYDTAVGRARGRGGLDGNCVTGDDIMAAGVTGSDIKDDGVTGGGVSGAGPMGTWFFLHDLSGSGGGDGGGASHRVQVPLHLLHGRVTQGVSVCARLIRDPAICPLPRGGNGWANRDIYFLDGSRRVGRDSDRWRST